MDVCEMWNDDTDVSKTIGLEAENTTYLQWLMIHLTEAPPRAS